MTAYIILNGECTDGLSEYITDNGRIYCADGGAEHLRKYNVVPDIIMGDMDSISKDTKEYFENTGCQFQVFPCEKDETDGQLIVDRAIADKPDKIVILCGCGGRIDHFLGNLQLLYRIAKNDISGIMIDKSCKYIMDKSSIEIDKEEHQLITIIPYEDNTYLTLTGFRYNVSNFKFEKDTPIGLSNYLLDDKGEVSVVQGCPLVIITNEQ